MTADEAYIAIVLSVLFFFGFSEPAIMGHAVRYILMYSVGALVLSILSYAFWHGFGRLMGFQSVFGTYTAIATVMTIAIYSMTRVAEDTDQGVVLTIYATGVAWMTIIPLHDRYIERMEKNQFKKKK